MAYITQANLETRFGASEILKLQGGTAQPALIAAVIADAESLIDSYLSKQFSLPLPSVPAVIVKIACDIARFYLYDDKPSDAVKAAYEEAVKFLSAVATGKAALPGVADTALSGSASPDYIAGSTQFDDAKLVGY